MTLARGEVGQPRIVDASTQAVSESDCFRDRPILLCISASRSLLSLGLGAARRALIRAVPGA
jgi:hypothetical protein